MSTLVHVPTDWNAFHDEMRRAQARKPDTHKQVKLVGGPLNGGDHFAPFWSPTIEFYCADEDDRTILIHTYVPTHFHDGYLVCEYRGVHQRGEIR